MADPNRICHADMLCLSAAQRHHIACTSGGPDLETAPRQSTSLSLSAMPEGHRTRATPREWTVGEYRMMDQTKEQWMKLQCIRQTVVVSQD